MNTAQFVLFLVGHFIKEVILPLVTAIRFPSKINLFVFVGGLNLKLKAVTVKRCVATV